MPPVLVALAFWSNEIYVGGEGEFSDMSSADGLSPVQDTQVLPRGSSLFLEEEKLKLAITDDTGSRQQ